ncbi:hypothetical protein BDZ89DRAFT_1116354 [Hymenopellis radicata]|nr:hypothetical protein BDZ89DRAFT_1116354 [Hymenopellis radicata]
MSSGSSNPSSSTSIGTFPLAAAIVGGVATCCVLAMTIYLLIQRRRRRRDEKKFVLEDIHYDVEKGRSITPPPAIYHNKGRHLISAVPQDFQVLERPTIAVIPTLNISSTSSISPPPRKDPQDSQRPTITVVTDIPTTMTPQMTTPKTPKTPKWKLKRVPVPRFSRLPPTPVAITRSRSWLPSPRQFRKSFDRNREAKGLPASSAYDLQGERTYIYNYVAIVKEKQIYLSLARPYNVASHVRVGLSGQEAW